MGSPASETGRNPDETPHTVTLTRAFLLGRHEVTQQEWRVVMGTSPVSSPRPARDVRSKA
jgi:formylglycine-generating enzyme required for sulfatase activity